TATHTCTDAAARRLRRQIHDRLSPRVTEKLVCAREALAARVRPGVQFLRHRCKPAALGMETQRLDPPGRSARLVPMVLPLLHRPAHTEGRPEADRAVESDPAARAPGAETLRARRSALPPATAAGAAALGLRQPQDLTGLFRRNRRGARGAALPARHDRIDHG